MTELRKARVATASLAGCFGCHMAILDMDERLIDLMGRVDLDHCAAHLANDLGLGRPGERTA